VGDAGPLLRPYLCLLAPTSLTWDHTHLLVSMTEVPKVFSSGPPKMSAFLLKVKPGTMYLSECAIA